MRTTGLGNMHFSLSRRWEEAARSRAGQNRDNRLLLLIMSSTSPLKDLNFTSEVTLHTWHNSTSPDTFHFTPDRAFISVFIHRVSKYNMEIALMTIRLL